MKTLVCYYMILNVYISLWTCQVIVGHSTHSLIVLADSYINLYKILDITLGILHLKTQLQIKELDKESHSTINHHVAKLFGHYCTYDLKRLPILGSFVNGLFLAALLMSAAIEGVQTCFHVGHLSDEGETSILMQHPITYPCILAGFATVGAMMQWCSSKAHEMREEELQSESLLELSGNRGDIASSRANVHDTEDSDLAVPMMELNAGHLCRTPTIPTILDKPHQTHLERIGQDVNSDDNKLHTISLEIAYLSSQQPLNLKKLDATQTADSFETVPLDDKVGGNERLAQISSNSIPWNGADAGASNKNGKVISSISKDLEGAPSENKTAASFNSGDRWWLTIRYCTSPIALLACALIFYFVNNDFITEIADASLAILVVVLLFTSSYPPMKKAGKVLLQTAPDAVDLDLLKSNLMALSPIIADISDFHVWSLTARTNRIATCKILINAEKVESTQQIAILLREAKFKFLEQNIKCTTIQPTFVQPAA